jgi:lysophospholipase L1-like esterase
VRIKVYGKKDASTVVLQKEFPITKDTETVDILLTKEETKIGGVISKPVVYWYEIELNPHSDPQTIIGYDEDGAKEFRLFPEGKDVPPDEPIKPEDIPIVDDELDLTSTRPVENQAIARAIVQLRADYEETKKDITATSGDTAKVANENKARLDNLVAHTDTKVSQSLEYVESISEATKAKLDASVDSDGVFATIKVNWREANQIYGGTSVDMFLIPIECSPIEVGLIHTEDGLEYRIKYDKENERYYLSLTAQSNVSIAPSGAGVVTMTYALGEYEVKDIRVGEDGKQYPSAGDAVRKQFAKVFTIFDTLDDFINLNSCVKAINKYNINDPRNRDNVFVNFGGYVDASGYSVTHPIYVKKGCRYKMPFLDSMGTNTSMIYVETNGDFIESEKGVPEDGFIVFTPSKSGYAAFNIGNRVNTREKFMVCIAEEYPDTYIPFVNPFDHEFIKHAFNPLYGKSIALNGDSICAGAGFAGGYGKIIAENNNMVYQNVAIGGGTIAAETYSGETKRHWICRAVEKMDASADYAILEGGVNDAALRVPLGTLSDGYEDALDESTYIGAFESMLKQTIFRFAGKKIGYIAVHKMTTKYDSRYTDGSYYYAAKECCEKWGVPFLDLNTQVPRFMNFADLKNTYTHQGDGWHPNEAGYKAYYVPKIEAWLKTL